MDYDLDPDILALIGRGITSVWALEVLLLLLAAPERAWDEEEIVRELRASPTVVREAIAATIALGAADRVRQAAVIYAATDALDATVRRLAATFRTRPLAVMKAIAAAPDARIRIFADAFRLKP